MIQIKRAYEAPSKKDGARFLVDRLWPRGVAREALQITPGSRMPPQAMSFASAFTAIQKSGGSFATIISLSSRKFLTHGLP